MNDLINALRRFVNIETCPVKDQCVAGFVSGAHTGWGWARTRVDEILKKHFKPSPIPEAALHFFPDGNQWCCVFSDFENLQESPAGFGDTVEEAMHDLIEQDGCATCDGCGRVTMTDKVVTDARTKWQRSADYSCTDECPDCNGSGHVHPIELPAVSQ